MPTVFCPHCNMKQVIPRDLLGEDVDCPGCNVDFTAELEDDREPVRRRSSRKQGSPPVVLVCYSMTLAGAILLVMPCLWFVSVPVSAVAALLSGFSLANQKWRHTGLTISFAISLLAAIVGAYLVLDFYLHMGRAFRGR